MFRGAFCCLSFHVLEDLKIFFSFLVLLPEKCKLCESLSTKISSCPLIVVFPSFILIPHDAFLGGEIKNIWCYLIGRNSLPSNGSVLTLIFFMYC